MQLNLTDDDARTLRNLLADYLPNLRRQHAATDIASREMKQELGHRVEVIERVLADLDPSAGAASR